jgi:mannosyltransferase OCH1-like enzyme
LDDIECWRPDWKSNSVKTHVPSQKITTIPSRIHFVWISIGLRIDRPQAPVPVSVQNRIEHWKKLHLNWDIVIWDNQLVREHFPDLAKLAALVPREAWAADLIRYALLERFGGIYLDTDIEPIRSLGPLLHLGAFTVCESPPNRIIQGNAGNMIMSQSRCGHACNAVIGAVPAHLSLRKALTDSVTNTQKRLTSVSFLPKDYNTAISGPPAWTKAAKQEGVQFLIPKTFYPCNYDESGNAQRCSASILSEDPSIFASHLWLKSWG